LKQYEGLDKEGTAKGHSNTDMNIGMLTNQDTHLDVPSTLTKTHKGFYDEIKQDCFKEIHIY
jgi:hypothetical protein